MTPTAALRTLRRMIPRLLVTGGSGFLGAHLCERARDAWDVSYTCRARSLPPGAGEAFRLDLGDAAAVARVVRAARPEVLLHTAYSPVEADFDAVIVRGTEAVARAAAETGAALVHVSTDMVFDGESAPYDEDAEPRPVFPYGRAKAEAEGRARRHCPDALLVRPSLLYALAPPDPRLARNLADADAGREVVLFDDEWRCPAEVGDMADALLAVAVRLLAQRRGSEAAPLPPVLHLPGPDRLTRWGFGIAVLTTLGAPLAAVRRGTARELGLARPRDLTLATRRTPPEFLRPLRPLAAVLAAPRR